MSGTHALVSHVEGEGRWFWGSCPPQQGVGCLLLWLGADSVAGWMLGVTVLVPGTGAEAWVAPQGRMEGAAGPGRTR